MDINNTTILGAVVDRLAQIKQQIADLQQEEKDLKAELVEAGVPVIDGFYHRAAISECAGRAVTDWQAVAKRLNPSHQLIAAHTTQGASYFTVRVSSRRTTA